MYYQLFCRTKKFFILRIRYAKNAITRTLYFKDMYIGLLRLNADLLNNMILKRLEMIINDKDLHINDRITTNN